jgi:16S rRNA A1518/A1519 N6-dimethyltransferase RsmA/KsgA/DIM1 with predicted DNA glycosylase/AP lyase activity
MFAVTVFFVMLVTGMLLADFYLIKELFRTKGLKISPHVTTHVIIRNMIIKFIKQHNVDNKKLRILDIGSGCGRMLFIMNKRISNAKFVGYEIDSKCYSSAKIKNKWENISFFNENINNLTDFNFDIILTFLFERQQKTLIHLYNKFPVGTLIISNTFKIPFEDGTYDLFDVLKSNILMRKVYIYKKTGL